MKRPSIVASSAASRRVRRGRVGAGRVGMRWRRLEGGDRRRRPTTTIPATTTTTAPSRSRRSPACADPRWRQPHPARAVGEGREHRRRPARRPASTRPTSSTKRWSKATSPASSRCSTRTVPDVIGPVRSVRAEDPDIVWPLGGIFAYSGGAPVNVDAINAAPVHAVDENNARRRDVPQRAEPAAARRAAQPLRPRPDAVRARWRPGAAAARCSSTSPPARRRSTGRGVRRASTSASTPGYDPT